MSEMKAYFDGLEARVLELVQQHARMERAGNYMAQIVFNLSQRLGHVLAEDDCKLLGDCRDEWNKSKIDHVAGG